MRKKWSGQDVPRGASLAKSFELINSKTRVSSVKCPNILRYDEQYPLRIGAILAALLILSSEERDSIFCPPKTFL